MNYSSRPEPFVPARHLAIVTLLAALFSSGCAPAVSGTDADATNATDATDATDSATTGDTQALPDVQWPACSVPAVTVGGSVATDALASAPARCGQAPHRWLNDPTLGSIAERGARQVITVSTLRVLAQAANLMLPVTLEHNVTVEQVAYVTQDRGALLRATTLVAYPNDFAMHADLDVIVILHGTAGFNDSCAPSGSSDTRALVAAFASAGYVVVAPDYIGLRGLGGPTGFPHPYLVGQPTAIASLDAVRAGIRLVSDQHGPLCATARVGVIGGSQGGHAALWLDRLGPYYAPELTQVGVVATVPPADLTAEGNRALQSVVQATGNMIAFYGAAPSWYGLAPRLNEVFVAPFDTSVPAALAASCNPGSMLDVTSLDQIFQPALLSAAMSAGGLATVMPWGCLLAENSLTTTSIARIAPTRPGYGILYVLGENDQLVTTPIQRRSFETLCTGGMRMQYLECAGAGHTQTTLWALPEIFDFIRARFAGETLAAADTCTVRPAVRCRATPM